ncbi:hypothetical protein OTU49_008797 [Cherax quadricarinatus]|uniref:Uncharacterized protein n=1 Tax=Cherax quadricarinatus TaxID=27406 RepID=A0AAW0WEE1_CHEQU
MLNVSNSASCRYCIPFIYKLFQRMIPDSKTAQQLSHGRIKCAYIVKHDLTPFFQKQLYDALSKLGCFFTVSFDVFFNLVLLVEQMDYSYTFGMIRKIKQ